MDADEHVRLTPNRFKAALKAGRPQIGFWSALCSNIVASFCYMYIAAPIISGWLLEKTGGYEAPMMAVLVALVVGVLCYLFLIREEYAPKLGSA